MHDSSVGDPIDGEKVTVLSSRSAGAPAAAPASEARAAEEAERAAQEAQARAAQEAEARAAQEVEARAAKAAEAHERALAAYPGVGMRFAFKLLVRLHSIRRRFAAREAAASAALAAEEAEQKVAAAAAAEKGGYSGLAMMAAVKLLAKAAKIRKRHADEAEAEVEAEASAVAPADSDSASFAKGKSPSKRGKPGEKAGMKGKGGKEGARGKKGGKPTTSAPATLLSKPKLAALSPPESEAEEELLRLLRDIKIAGGVDAELAAHEAALEASHAAHNDGRGREGMHGLDSTLAAARLLKRMYTEHMPSGAVGGEMQVETAALPQEGQPSRMRAALPYKGSPPI